MDKVVVLGFYSDKTKTFVLKHLNRLLGAFCLNQNKAEQVVGIGIAGIGGKHAAIAGLGILDLPGALIGHCLLEGTGQCRAIGDGDICHGGNATHWARKCASGSSLNYGSEILISNLRHCDTGLAALCYDTIFERRED